jgi:hypothetical protein
MDLLDAISATGRSNSIAHIAFAMPPVDTVMRELLAARPTDADPVTWGNVVKHVKLSIGALTGYDLTDMRYAAQCLHGPYAAPALAANGASELRVFRVAHSNVARLLFLRSTNLHPPTYV